MGDRCTTNFSEIVYWNRVISKKGRRYRFAYVFKVAAQRAATKKSKSQTSPRVPGLQTRQQKEVHQCRACDDRPAKEEEA
jgi:hypothetical protein